MEEKEFGSVECCDRSGVPASVGLERGWTVGGLYGHFPVADFDAHRLGGVGVARMFWSERWCARIVHAARTPGRIAMPVIVNQKWSGQSKIARGAARWTAVELGGQLTFLSAHLPHKGKKFGEFEAVLVDIQEFVSGRPKQHVILGGDFNASLYSMTDFLHVRESIPRPRTLVDMNDSLRARACRHTMVTELDLTVTSEWMNADTKQELFTRSSWSNSEDSLTQMDFIMTRIGSRRITERCLLSFR